MAKPDKTLPWWALESGTIRPSTRPGAKIVIETDGYETPGTFVGYLIDERDDVQAIVRFDGCDTLNAYHFSKVRLQEVE